MKTYINISLKALTLIALIFTSGHVSAQCGTDLILPPNDFNPPMQNIRVNIHFMLANGGNNFRANDDGTGNTSYTGFDYAQDLVTAINNNILAQTEPMNLYVGAQPPAVYPKKWRVNLNGIYFHDDPTYKWYADVHANPTAVTYLNSTYGQDLNNTVNIYLFSDDPNNSVCCGYGPGTTIFIAHAWDSYVNQGWGAWSKAAITAHELGHNLSLHHTITSNCMGNCDDGCSDTPTYNQAIAAGFTNPLQWNSPTGENNMMGYNASSKAVTPCQLRKVYKRLLNSMSAYTMNSGCEYTGIDLQVSQNEIWDKKTRTFGDIIVKSGAHLIVKCSLIMSTNAHIIVEEGATLTVDGGIITTTCGSQWSGINVLGDSQASQYPQGGNFAQGRVILKNNAIIEHAKVGVEAFSGGMIQANSAQFLNNERDAEVKFYTNTYPSNAGYLAGLPAPNLSYFTNCDFLTTQTLNNSSGHPDKHLFFQYVDGITISNCRFKNTLTTNNSPITNRGYGIYSENASLKVRGTCTSIPQLGSPCLNYNETVFDGLGYGIFAISSNPMHNIEVSNCLFNTNWRGVYINGMDHSSVTQSTFHINEPPGWTWPFHPYEYNYGIYIRASTGFDISENNLDTQTDANYGIVTAYTNINVESTEEIYKNKFDGVSAATVAYGRNDGLLIRCNEYFNNPAVSIAIENYNGSLANPQGTCSDVAAPAGNFFDHTPCNSNSYEMWNNSTQFYINYNHHAAPSGYVPVCTWNFGVNTCNNLTYDPALSCPSRFSFFFNIDKETMVEQVRVEQAGHLVNLNDWSLFIDGGDQAHLLNEIHFQHNSTVLLETLNNASPYLSDVVMTELLTTENALNESEITAVLLSNSPLTETVMNVVQTMEPPMDQSNLDLLYSRQSGQSERSKLEDDILTTRREVELMTAQIIRSYRSIEEFTDGDIWQNKVLNYLNDLTAYSEQGLHSDLKIRIASTYMANGDLNTADQMLEEFENSTNNNRQSGIMRMEIAQLQQGNTIYDVSAPEIDQLILWSEDLEQQGHANASGTLELLGQIDYPEEFSPVSIDQREERETAEEQELVIQQDKPFSLFPNPSKGVITVKSNNLGRTNQVLHVYSISGQLMDEILIQDFNQNINLSRLENGFYFIHYKGHTEKLIITK